MTRLVVEADGGSRGNPGPAGYGALVRDADTGEVLAERAESIGRATNNVAEYRGLIAGLDAATELAPSSVDVRMDSKLVVEQMSGRWQVRHADLKPLVAQAMTLVRRLPAVRFTWIPRERNKHADRLANEAMDAAAQGRPWQPSTPNPEPSPPSGTAGWSAPTSQPTRMLLVRHGATKYSPERRFSGRGDVPLSEQGAAQADAVAERLSGTPDVAAVVSSPLKRTRETARRVAGALGADVVEDDGLVEADFGEWDGLTLAEARQRWPGEISAWMGSPDVAPPGGESFTAVARRVRRARDRLLAGYPGQTVVVVTHVTPIKTLLRMALDAPPSVLYRIHLDVAGLSVVDWFADGPAVVRLVNDTSHLGETYPGTQWKP